MLRLRWSYEDRLMFLPPAALTSSNFLATWRISGKPRGSKRRSASPQDVRAALEAGATTQRRRRCVSRSRRGLCRREGSPHRVKLEKKRELAAYTQRDPFRRRTLGGASIRTHAVQAPRWPPTPVGWTRRRRVKTNFIRGPPSSPDFHQLHRRRRRPACSLHAAYTVSRAGR